jgi:hypothetical protein
MSNCGNPDCNALVNEEYMTWVESYTDGQEHWLCPGCLNDYIDETLAHSRARTEKEE